MVEITMYQKYFKHIKKDISIHDSVQYFLNNEIGKTE